MAALANRYLAAFALLLCTGCQEKPAEKTFSERLMELPAPGQPNLTIASGPLVYACKFKSHGTIVIETDPRDARIVINGASIPADEGSNFFRAFDGSETVYFGPDRSYWEYQGERAENCVVSS